MTDGLDQALADAGLDLLRADGQLVMFDGAVPNPTPAPPYVLVYTSVWWPGENPDGSSLASLTTGAVVRWICHCVGANQDASRAVAQRVRTALLDVRPTVDGVNCGFIRHETGDPTAPVRDEITGAVKIETIDVYRMTAVR